MKNFYQSSARLVLPLLILAILGACNPKPEAAGDQSLKEIKLGYCPTMQSHAQVLAQAHQNVTLQQYENSGGALEALKAGQVQAALIGRVAWQHEQTQDLRLERMADGLTLIALHPGVIRFEDLPKIRILTHEPEAAIQDLIPVRSNVVYYEHSDEMRAAMDGSTAVLIRWSQVALTDNLVIPVDGAGNKITGFRSPHLYYLAAMNEALAPLLNALPAE